MIRKAVIVLLTFAALAALMADNISRQDHFKPPLIPMLIIDGDYAMKLGLLPGRCFVIFGAGRTHHPGGFYLSSRYFRSGSLFGFDLIHDPLKVQIKFAFWPFFFLFAAYPTLALVRGPVRRRRRRRKGLCIKCGYNLTGNVSGVCPECGTTIETNRPDEAETDKD